MQYVRMRIAPIIVNRLKFLPYWKKIWYFHCPNTENPNVQNAGSSIADLSIKRHAAGRTNFKKNLLHLTLLL
jgi:hypothetical protein